jgi:hypothetical protein
MMPLVQAPKPFFDLFKSIAQGKEEAGHCWPKSSYYRLPICFAGNA